MYRVCTLAVVVSMVVTAAQLDHLKNTLVVNMQRQTLVEDAREESQMLAPAQMEERILQRLDKGPRSGWCS